MKTLLTRAYNICSTYRILDLEFDFLKKYFLGNNYGTTIFFKTLNNFLHKVRRNETVERSDVPKLKKYIKLPYYGKSSFDLRKSLQKILKTNFPAVEFKFVFTNGFTIGSFFRTKDRIPESVCSNIVYKFECPNCHVRYLGVTSRALKIRIHEHLGKSHRTGLYLNLLKLGQKSLLLI